MYTRIAYSQFSSVLQTWSFMFAGNTHGSNQPQGILGGKQVYLMHPLAGGEPLCFEVPASSGPMRRDGTNYSSLPVL